MDITIEHEIDRNDAYFAQWVRLSSNARFRKRYMLGAVALLYFCAGNIICGGDGFSYAFSIAFTVLLLLPIVKTMVTVSRYFQGGRTVFCISHFTSDEISVTTPDGRGWKCKWDALSDIIFTKKLVCLIYGKNGLFFLRRKDIPAELDDHLRKQVAALKGIRR